MSSSARDGRTHARGLRAAPAPRRARCGVRARAAGDGDGRRLLGERSALSAALGRGEEAPVCRFFAGLLVCLRFQIWLSYLKFRHNF